MSEYCLKRKLDEEVEGNGEEDFITKKTAKISIFEDGYKENCC